MIMTLIFPDQPFECHKAVSELSLVDQRQSGTKTLTEFQAQYSDFRTKEKAKSMKFELAITTIITIVTRMR